ncbi:hypothetical protein IJ596_01625 [bacterium]|nr:hypothetical protein [bacterium]
MSGLQAVEGFVERVVPGVGKVMVSDSKVIPNNRIDALIRRNHNLKGFNEQVAALEPDIAHLTPEQIEAQMDIYKRLKQVPEVKEAIETVKANSAAIFYARQR